MMTAAALLLAVLLGGCTTYPQYTYGYGPGYYRPGYYGAGYYARYPASNPYGYSPYFPYEYYGGYGSSQGGNS
jgi:hypothetical protein